MGPEFWRNRDGASATEFALTLGLLVPFLFATITFGWMFFFDNNMETAVREGARRLAAGEVQYAGVSTACSSAKGQNTAYAEGVVCSMLPAQMGGDITVTATCAGATDEEAFQVQASIAGEDAAMGDIFGFFDGSTVTSSAEWFLGESCPGAT